MANQSASDEYDFGFSFTNDENIQSQNPAVNNEELTSLQVKIDSLLDNQTKLLEDKLTRLMEDKYKAKLKEVENLIMPLLVNLKKNPEKEYIHWPNRGPIIDKQIEKITAITRS